MEHHPTLLRYLLGLEKYPDWVEISLLSWMVILFLSGISIYLTRDLKQIPGRAQAFAEWIVEFFESFVVGIVGDHGRKFVPYVGSLFMFILFQNMLIQIPGFNAPTANANTTVSLAVITFIIVQFHGVSVNGIKGYLHHFAGSPHDVTGWALAPLMFPLELIGEFAKPLSLSMRLFGNITGEDTVIIILMGLAVHSLYYIPVHIPMAFFGIFGGTVQALVFSMLTCIYLKIMSGHGEEHH